MEMKTAFSIILGIMMVATVIVAMIALMGSLTTVSLEECNYYDAKSYYGGEDCGTTVSGQLRCSDDDECIDYKMAKCCEPVVV